MLDVSPDNAWALARRGRINRHLERFQEALADFTHALELTPENHRCWYRRAQINLLVGDVEAFNRDIASAINRARLALEGAPNAIQSEFHLALYYLAAESAAEARARYQRLFTECESLDQLTSARDEIGDLLSIQPSNELARNILDQIDQRSIALKPPALH
jgi:tetratricopeptide (TPR) repeat protein